MSMQKTKRSTNHTKRRHTDNISIQIAPSTISIEQNQFVLEQTNAWINNADTKVSISCGLISAVFAIIAFFCENFATEISRKTILMYPILFKCAVVFAGVAVLTFFIALFFYFSAISPRFWGFKKNPKCQHQYSMFYEDIATFCCADKYVDCVMHATEKQYHEEIQKEIFFNSKICSEKMHKYKTGLKISFLSILLAVVATVLFIILASKEPCSCARHINSVNSLTAIAKFIL